MKHIQKRKKERVPDKSLDLICTERKKERKKESCLMINQKEIMLHMLALERVSRRVIVTIS